MSTFNARSATEALYSWSPIWFDVNGNVNSSTIIRWIHLCSVYFPTRQNESVGCQSGFESFEVGQNRASSVANDPTRQNENVGCQSGFESFEVGQNRSSSVANDPTKCVGCQGGFEILEDEQNRASSVANDPTKCVGSSS